MKLKAPSGKPASPKKVVIVGGGVAGMEAARVAKLRGHVVTLLEKSNALGGNLIPTGAHDFKAEVASLNDYYRHQMALLDVDIRMNTEATAETLKAMNADAIILAVGAAPVIPQNIPGIEKAVVGAQALLETTPVGEKVVIVGGGLIGCEIAYGYAKEGKTVTIVELLDELMKTGSVPAMNKAMLLDAFEFYGTQVLTSTRLKEITDTGAVLILPSGEEKTIAADCVILAIGYRPLPSLAQALSGCGAKIHEIGDGARVGNILTCIRDAYQTAKSL